MTAERHAVGVCGFGRCGSTMAMAMLDAGGLPPVEGAQPGSYEHTDDHNGLALDLAAYPSHAIKLLNHMVMAPLPAVPWRFVWLDRDPVQQAISAVKLMQAVGVMEPFATRTHAFYGVQRLAESYRRDRFTHLGALRRRGPVTVVRYEDVLAVPKRGAKLLAKAWPDLDRRAAAAVVHDRDAACRPDLAAEARIVLATVDTSEVAGR